MCLVSIIFKFRVRSIYPSLDEVIELFNMQLILWIKIGYAAKVQTSKLCDKVLTNTNIRKNNYQTQAQLTQSTSDNSIQFIN